MSLQSILRNINIDNVKEFLYKLYHNRKIKEEIYNSINYSLDSEQYYSKDYLAIYLEKDYLKKIEELNISEKQLHDELSKNLEYSSKYTNTDGINSAWLNLLVLNDKLFKEELITRKKKLQEMFKIEDFKIKFLGLLGNKIKDPNHFFELFTFDFDAIFKKTHSPYIFILTTILNNNKLENITTKDDMIKHNIWNIPVFNSPRDINFKSNKDLNFFIENIHVSPEYRLMRLLLDEKIINHNFSDNEIDYILSVYRCCVGGDIKDILEIFKNNSKYYTILPFIALLDCKLELEISKQFCDSYPDFYEWAPLKNAVGFQTAASVPIIFPYIFKSNILQNRYETITFETSKHIGTLIIKNKFPPTKDEYKYKEYLLYNIKIKDKEVMFFDIHGNRVHLKESPISYQRVQLLESKWAINRLIWLLEHSKIIPYEKKECDVIVYKINKDYYLFSLFNKLEIRKMYNNLKTSLIGKIKDPIKMVKINDMIDVFIRELNGYEEITKYKLTKDNNTLFIWQIDPNDLSSWDKKVLKKNKKIYSNCESSDLYVHIETGEEAFNKKHVALDFNEKSLQELYNKQYYEAVRYHQNDDYKTYIEEQKKKIKLYKQLDTSRSNKIWERALKHVPDQIWERGRQLPTDRVYKIKSRQHPIFFKYLKYKIKYLKLKNLISTNI
jgi:hypothetical protein